MQGSGCRVQGAGCRVQGEGFRVQGAGCRVQGAGFRDPRIQVRFRFRGSRLSDWLFRGPKLLCSVSCVPDSGCGFRVSVLGSFVLCSVFGSLNFEKFPRNSFSPPAVPKWEHPRVRLPIWNLVFLVSGFGVRIPDPCDPCSAFRASGNSRDSCSPPAVPNWM